MSRMIVTIQIGRRIYRGYDTYAVQGIGIIQAEALMIQDRNIRGISG